ncbi:hypothetical protein BO82DRAFT_80084 [Aspergillus uvarum CBS 121591]|uniref:Transmembrane protein n=1 Tax=Aspergillus uvarum CBS 121591 TaxID=1448315 RepID=A0A319DQG6_9EURO|nr:hypothetical protein BO82DRAFT_80084 [Aspergillus uvarum CBS 121591]PYH81482.1 hypothetical protein BO82DRAFT_80084 [Aspergillus uvarum CBS 121591]
MQKFRAGDPPYQSVTRARGRRLFCSVRFKVRSGCWMLDVGTKKSDYYSLTLKKDCYLLPPFPYLPFFFSVFLLQITLFCLLPFRLFFFFLPPWFAALPSSLPRVLC